MKKIIFLLTFIFLNVFFNTYGASEISTGDTTKFRIVISFFSQASGIDIPAKKEVDAYIGEFEKANSCILVKNETQWGREGEIDYCMNFPQIKSKIQKKFVKKVKEIAKKSGRITIIENSPCIHKR